MERGPGHAGCVTVGGSRSVVVAVAATVAFAAPRVAPLPQSRSRSRTARAASGWAAPRSGVRTFAVHNEGRNAADDRVDGGRTPTVSTATWRSSPPDPHGRVAVRLPPGRYQWRCELASGATVLSKAEAVTGRAVRGGHAAEPVTLDELTPIATQVRDATQAAGSAGSRPTRMGSGPPSTPAASTTPAPRGSPRTSPTSGSASPTGPSATSTPGSTAGRMRCAAEPPTGTGPGSSASSTGCGLASRHRRSRPVADQLDTDVHALVADFPNEFTDVRDIPLRVHEILENTLQFDLTGDSDQGSHTALATARANVDGTRSLLAAVTPLLRPRAPELLAASNAWPRRPRGPARPLPPCRRDVARSRRSHGLPSARSSTDGSVNSSRPWRRSPTCSSCPRDAGQD